MHISRKKKKINKFKPSNKLIEKRVDGLVANVTSTQTELGQHFGIIDPWHP